MTEICPTRPATFDVWRPASAGGGPCAAAVGHGVYTTRAHTGGRSRRTGGGSRRGYQRRQRGGAELGAAGHQGWQPPTLVQWSKRCGQEEGQGTIGGRGRVVWTVTTLATVHWSRTQPAGRPSGAPAAATPARTSRGNKGLRAKENKKKNCFFCICWGSHHPLRDRPRQRRDGSGLDARLFAVCYAASASTSSVERSCMISNGGRAGRGGGGGLSDCSAP